MRYIVQAAHLRLSIRPSHAGMKSKPITTLRSYGFHNR